MSIDLKKFFRLGLDSTDQPLDQSLIVHSRTAPDNVNTPQKKLTFKVPKYGVLTADSMLVVSLKKESAVNNSRLNLLNGILGAIDRVVVRADNKIITGLSGSSYKRTVELYSESSLIHMANYWKRFLGNNLLFDVVSSTGALDDGSAQTLQVNKKIVEYVSPAGAGDCADLLVYDDNLATGSVGDNTKSFGIPLYLLSTFFRNNALPVFLMTATRDIVIEVYFNANPTHYIITDNSVADTAINIDLNNCELMTTHILQDPELEGEILQSARQTPRTYVYNDEYLVRHKIASGTADINETVRVNLNTRRLNKFLIAFKPVRTATYSASNQCNQVCAEQLSTAFGEQTLQVKMNGVEIFQHPVASDPLLFHLTTIYNKGKACKFLRTMTSYNNHMANYPDANVESADQNLSSVQLKGVANYLGVNVENGNPGPLLSSTVQNVPLEIKYTSTRNTPKNTNNAYPINRAEHEMYIYPSVFKQLSISPQLVEVSY